jgi:hypothetical protein
LWPQVVATRLPRDGGSAGTATAGGPPSIAAGPAFGFVPSHNVNHQKPRGHLSLLAWHSGPVMHSTTAVPVFWGSSWSNSFFTNDKVTGLDYLYSHVVGLGTRTPTPSTTTAPEM